ncbi:hypothetical protein BSKO_03087 [Bryopsis sp. KO-2023]|nr:hypothetical protein BSKO_03087 [Bryopsis sp. KO-2023]
MAGRLVGANTTRPPRAVTRAAYRGPGSNFSQGQNQGQNAPGRIILPGQRAPPSSPGRLIVPGEEQQAQNVVDDSVAPPRKMFRPPPGFMDEAGPDDSSIDMTVEQMLAKLKGGSELWHKLARYFPKLAVEGFDAVVLEEMTGLTKANQNVMSVAANVYASVAKSKDSEEVLDFFDNEGGQYLLYELRFLSGEPRVSAARYIARNNLSQEEALELARAIKEHIRRQGKKEGFSSDPEDCLAYKHYRTAIEVRSRETKVKSIEKGLAVALSPTAVAALEKLMEEAMKTEKKRGSIGALPVVKLMKEEVGFRPIPVVGQFHEVSEEDLAACPFVRQTGAFGTFTTSADQDTRWVVVPRWEALLSASKPFALEFKNVNAIPAAAAASLGQSAEKRRKLKGSAMVFADRDVGEMDYECFYVVNKADGYFDILQGHPELSGVVARVIMIVRPPDEELVYDSLGGLEI